MDEIQSDMSLSRQSTPLNFLDLNNDVFDEIFSHLSFDELAKIRLVTLLKYMLIGLYLLLRLLFFYRLVVDSTKFVRVCSTKALLLLSFTALIARRR